MLTRELRALQALDGIAGMPPNPVRVDRYAIAYRFMPGRTLRRIKGTPPSGPFFEQLEAAVKAMHCRGWVHLDLRNARNVIERDDGAPGLLDFQSALQTRYLLPPFRRLLERVDLSGVYKHWCKYAPESLGMERAGVLRRQLRLRNLWLLRGYSWRPRRHKLRKRERELLARTDDGRHLEEAE
jgi:RIO-like serine/threonine protein kinase